MHVLCWIIEAYTLICIARVVFSFLDLQGGGGLLSAVSTLCYTLTEPLFASVRRVLPRAGDLPIDFSPAIIIILLGILRSIVCAL